MRAKGARAEREEEERLTRDVGRPALEAVEVCVADRPAAPDVARSHTRDRDSVDDRVEPAEDACRLRERGVELRGVEHVGANRMGAAGADGVESLVALRDRGAVPAVCEGAVEDRAAEVPGAERDELRHQRPRRVAE